MRCARARGRGTPRPQPGGSVIAQQLAYMMLIQALRLYLADAASAGRGWLSALPDNISWDRPCFSECKSLSHLEIFVCEVSQKSSHGACSGSVTDTEPEANNRNASTTSFGTSSRFRFVKSSCPTPGMGSSTVGVRMSVNAATTSSMEPNPSRVP
jgi:hypothetical protein